MRGARRPCAREPALWLALAALACGEAAAPAAPGEAHAAAGGIAIHAPRIPASAGDVAALYLVAIDRDGRGDRLIGVQSDVGEALLHETREEDGLLRMQRAREGLAIPAGGALRLEPGGPHVMLMGLPRPLETGSRVHVTLEFERAGLVALEVPVVSEAERADVGAPGSVSAPMP